MGSFVPDEPRLPVVGSQNSPSEQRITKDMPITPLHDTRLPSTVDSTMMESENTTLPLEALIQ